MRGYTTRRFGPLAQLVEQGTLNPKVEGSIPSRPIPNVRVPQQVATHNPISGDFEAHRRASQEAADAGVRFLAEAGEELAASLDWEATLVRVAQLAVPTLADWCIVDVLEDDGKTIRQVTVAAIDREKEDLLREMRMLYPPTMDSPQPAARALRAGEPVVFPEFDPETLATTTRDERHFELMTKLAPRAAMAAPLIARGHILGTLTLAWSESERVYGPAEVALALGLASRAALAVDSAILFAREREARAEAEDAVERLRAASRRLEFLAEASEVLGSTLDYATALQRLSALAVPYLGDWCLVDMVDPSGRLERLAIAHMDPLRLAAAPGFQKRFPPDPDSPHGPGHVVRTGRAELIHEVTDEHLKTASRGDEKLLAALRRIEMTSLMSLPLIARGRVIGALTLLSDRTDRLFGDADLATAEELARRAAIAVDNALLFDQAERRGDAARVLEHIADGVFMLDADGVARLWNRAAEAVTLLKADEVVGRPADDAIPGWAQIAGRVPVASAPAAATRAETVPLELPGRELWLSITGVSFAEGTVYAFRDLTEERVLEELRADFVSTVSHELRTPLAAIYGAALTLQREDLRLEGDQRDKLLGMISGESDRLARTVNDILWASRLDAERLQVSIGSHDAEELTRTVIEAARVHKPEEIELSLSLEADLPPVAADPDKVRQVLTNLVDNAIKYSPDGGRVEVGVTRREHALCFSVRDEGLGIAQAEQRRIFDKFYRVDPNLTRGVGGTGLGLYICRELVRRMNGTIWVDSREREGSRFTFELPVA
jgi:PAS domain S-box-containing protein